MNFSVNLFSSDITGQWWSYNQNDQDYDELIIDDNLGFVLNAVISGEHGSHKGQIQIIGDGNYYAQISYNDTIKNCMISYYVSRTELSLIIYENENERLYSERFLSTKEFPGETRDVKDTRKFIFFPTWGVFGGNFNRINASQNEFLFSVDIYTLNFYFPAGLELEVVPVKYFYNFSTKSQMMSFLNIGLGWNILQYPLDIDTKHFLGPVVSVNYLNLYDFSYLDFNQAIFNAGLKFSLWEYDALHLLTLEGGYKNTGGSHGYYFSILIGNVYPFVISILGTAWPLFFYPY